MQVNGNTNQSIHFGSFELKPESGELFRDGVNVKLPPQPFKVMVVLVENAGHLVAREEIQRLVWGDDTFVDFDKGLNFCIKQIREALGDNAQSPRFIETLPRRGYRFIAPVEKLPVTNSVNGSAINTTSTPASKFSITSSPSPTENPPPQPAASISTISQRSLAVGRLYKWGIAIAVLATLAAYPLWRYLKPQAPSPAGKKMLVVLPFENLNADTNEDYFSDGLTEEMITQLGRLQPRKLGVIARTTALTYKKSQKDVRQIGQELGVSYVLEGSVRREVNRVRITAQLIQVSDQTHLWSETYERSERDMLQIQSEVARRVANSLALELLPSLPRDSAGAAAVNSEAYDAYLKGRFLVTKDTLPDLERSIPYFDQAIEKAPDFAPAYAAAVDARVLLSTWNNTFSAEVLNRAKADALKAVELDPALGEAYAALGAVNFWFEWNWSEAEKNIKRGIELNPSNPNSHILYADFLLSQGQTEAAVSHIQQAIELDPVSLLTNGLAAFFYLRARHYDDAITQAQRMLELEPKSPAAKDCLTSAYRYKGMYQEMREVIQKRVTAENNRKALVALNQGDAKESIERIERNQLKELKEAVARGEKRNTLWAAHLAAQLGEKDLALEWLEKASEERLPFCVFLNIQPDFDTLRQDRRFADLMRRMRLSG